MSTTLQEPPQPECAGCQRHPAQIPDLIAYAKTYKITPDEYVRREEGTYNPANGHFLCDICYIRAGMPSSPHGWVCP